MEANDETVMTGIQQWWSSSLRLFGRRNDLCATVKKKKKKKTRQSSKGAFHDVPLTLNPTASWDQEDDDDVYEHTGSRHLQHSPQIPDEVWIENIFPFLNRWSQNRLAEASRAVFLARPRLLKHQQWPANGCLRCKRVVQSVAFSPTSSTRSGSSSGSSCSHDHLIVTMARSKKIFIHDKLRGPLLGPPLTGHTGPVVDAKFSPHTDDDNTTLATAGRNDGTIRLWRFVNDKYSCFRLLYTYLNDLRHIVWSPNAQYIAAWGPEGFARVIEVKTGRRLSFFWRTRLEVLGCHETVAFAPDSQSLALAYNHEVVRLWHWETDTFQVLPGSADPTGGRYAGTYVTAVAYSPDYRYLAVGCHVSTIKLWTVVARAERNGDDNGRNSFLYKFYKKLFLGKGWSAVTLLQFTPDSRYIACTGNGSQIRLIQISSGTIVGVFNGHTAAVEKLCFSSSAEGHGNQGIVLASCGRDRSVRLWNVSECLK